MKQMLLLPIYLNLNHQIAESCFVRGKIKGDVSVMWSCVSCCDPEQPRQANWSRATKLRVSRTIFTVKDVFREVLDPQSLGINAQIRI